MPITNICIYLKFEMLQQMSKPILQQPVEPQMLNLPSSVHKLLNPNKLPELHPILLLTKRCLRFPMFRLILRKPQPNDVHHLYLMQTTLWCKLHKQMFVRLPGGTVQE
jgi:hypothetical protein